MTENESVKKSIEVFEKLSKHIKYVHKCKNGMEFLIYSQDLVLAFETAIDCLKEIRQYRVIGTVEECWEARERQRAKKRKLDSYCGFNSYECPVCGAEPVEGSNFCHKCGQRLG